MSDSNPSFADVKSRLEEIADEVAKDDVSLDDALALYEEAVKLGLSACDLSESDIFPEEMSEIDGEVSDASEAGASAAGVEGAGAVDAVDDSSTGLDADASDEARSIDESVVTSMVSN